MSLSQEGVVWVEVGLMWVKLEVGDNGGAPLFVHFVSGCRRVAVRFRI